MLEGGAVVSLQVCPGCQERCLDVREYDSMMVLRPNLAMFSLSCPHCAAKVSMMQPIPPELRDEVDFAAIEVGARMGRE